MQPSYETSILAIKGREREREISCGSYKSNYFWPHHHWSYLCLASVTCRTVSGTWLWISTAPIPLTNYWLHVWPKDRTLTMQHQFVPSYLAQTAMPLNHPAPSGTMDTYVPVHQQHSSDCHLFAVPPLSGASDEAQVFSIGSPNLWASWRGEGNFLAWYL